MRTHKDWQGVRMRRVVAGMDPDAPPQTVTIPASWEDEAASALLALVPGRNRPDLREAAERWLARLDAAAPLAPGLAGRLRALLIRRRGAPGLAVWHDAPGTPAFVLNLAAFAEPDRGFDADGFAGAAADAVRALTLLAPDAPALAIGIADLAGALARLGLRYDSDAGREAAVTIAALLRRAADGATIEIGAPGPVEALLGAETGGIAPAFGLVRPEGGLTRAAAAYLAATGTAPEAALAAVLAGDAASVLPETGAGAHAAMHDAVAPFLHAMPRRPASLAVVPPVPSRREMPARHGGATRKAAIGGHRLFLRTAEYPDGRLGEMSVALPKDGPVARGLMDGLAAAVSIGLQHGVPLDEYVEAFALSRFGPAGVVEGDPAVSHASSVLDYLARTLAAAYLNRTDLPEPVLDEPESGGGSRAPELPLPMPEETARSRRGTLRLVSR